MEEQHRKKILDNIDKMVDGLSLNDLLNQLQKKKMFNSYMINEILHTEEERKFGFLYWYVTTRGPTAFADLCDAFKELNRSDLATLLSKGPNTVNVFLNGRDSNQPSLDEQYPDNEKWLVTEGSEEFDLDCQKVYRMRSWPRGLALIININKYVNDTLVERKGSEKDVARLQEILPQLGYEVIVEEDLCADDMLEKVKEFSHNKKHSQCDSAMVFVMAHGSLQKGGSNAVLVAAWDAQLVNWYNIVNLLSAHKCEDLRGKPKMFFFQTCWGDSYNYPVKLNGINGVREDYQNNEVDGRLVNGHSTDVVELQNGEQVQTDSACLGFTDVIRSDSDIFIGHATSPGNVSVRLTECGSWYIQTLCRVWARDAWCQDLYSMMQTVRQEAIRLGLRKDFYIEETDQGFNRLLYFQPGIGSTQDPIITLNKS